MKYRLKEMNDSPNVLVAYRIMSLDGNYTLLNLMQHTSNHLI